MTDRHALPRAAGSIRLIGEKKNHRLSRWVAFLLREYLELTYLTLYHVAYITGNTMSVSMVATSRPPLNAMASGLQNTDPMSGIIPRMAAMAVSMIGLKRNVAELMMASRADCPSAR